MRRVCVKHVSALAQCLARREAAGLLGDRLQSFVYYGCVSTRQEEDIENDNEQVSENLCVLSMTMRATMCNVCVHGCAAVHVTCATPEASRKTGRKRFLFSYKQPRAQSRGR